ncbi:MAG: hypothetical protein L3J04_05345 [Robiginitomaculum sp.]|nr:hypothetical protein [Robiginitomaculum sp.]
MNIKNYLPLFAIIIIAGCASVNSSQTVEKSNSNVAYTDPQYGVLLMAHGGTAVWNASVVSAIKPLQDYYPIEIAFGMADANSIQEAVTRLETKGVSKIGVVRLFISGESWYQRTEKILGLREGAPQFVDHSTHDMGDMVQMPNGHKMGFWKIKAISKFAMSKEGLGNSELMDVVLEVRAEGLSQNPADEDVLILAHGPGDDEENQRWIAAISERTSLIDSTFPFRRVQVMTLREDWRAKRVMASKEIRHFVKRAEQEGGIAIVIPFRVQGFGPYAKVLDGLNYVSDEKGLLPHANVTAWIENQADALQSSGFIITE